MRCELQLRRSSPVAGLAAVLMFVAAVWSAAEAGAEERIARSAANPWYVYDRPQTFTFLDISQNNSRSARQQGQRILEVREYLAASRAVRGH